MPTYPGNPGIHLERVLWRSRGDGANVSRLDMGVHTGTHVDAPCHFLDDGPSAETLPLDVLTGPCTVVESERLDAAAIDALDLAPGTERVLFRTPNGALWERDDFVEDFVSFDGGGARRLLERGVRLAGIDYLSIGDQDAHVAFLSAGLVAVEGLDLRAVRPGDYWLAVLPLRLVGSDGGPARAVLWPTTEGR
jgi:arylformamidase